MERAGTTFAVIPGADGTCRAIRQRDASGDGVGRAIAREPVVVVGADCARSRTRSPRSCSTDDGFVAVFDGRTYRGTLTPDAIYRALRTSRHPNEHPVS